jgi:hypothetical protein
MSVHFESSTYREKLLEHLFIGEVLRYLWSQGVTNADLLRPEVDNGGYDLVITCNSVTRHIQLKASYTQAKTREQTINTRLAEKPSGCVIWLRFDATTLELGPFLWFGGPPGQPLPDIRTRRIGKQPGGNKKERPNTRELPKSVFEKIATIAELVGRLFGPLPPLSVNGRGRQRIVADVQAARRAFARGECRPATVEEIMNGILS